MSQRVVVGEAEYLKPVDYNRLGTLPQAAIEAVVGGAIGYGHHWAAFTVAKKSAQEVTISPGTYFEGRIVYEHFDIKVENLTTFLPIAASDEKWVALLLRGDTDQLVEDRSFATTTTIDPETALPVAIPTPVIARRFVKIAVQEGVPTPAPARRPVIADTDCCLAFIRLTTAGVQDIVPSEQHRAKTLAEVDGRVTAIEVRVDQLFEDTASLRTDLSNVSREVIELGKAITDRRLIAQLVRDTAQVRRKLALPEEARNYWFDPGLVKDGWDLANGLFRIREGIRHAYANQSDTQLRLSDPGRGDLSVFDGHLVLPRYTEVARITSPDGNGSKDISSIVHTVTTAIQHTQSHTSIRYGETVMRCENVAGWTDLASRRAGEIFGVGGESFVLKGVSDSPYNDLPTADTGHRHYDVQRVIKDTWTSTYTTYDVKTYGLSGSIVGNTFLNPQAFVATAIELHFTRVDANAPVNLFLCECGPTGAPDHEAVIARTVVQGSALKVGKNKFPIPPTLLEQGKRYAWFAATTGNHALMTSDKNAFLAGSSFLITDGAWAQLSTTDDFTFTVYGARFAQNRTVVQFNSVSLENGMSEIEMIYRGWEPSATKLVWEVQAQGDTEWVPMDGRLDNPLAGLPPLINLRAVFLGTPDVAPAIDLTSYSRVIAGRHRLDMQAPSKLITFGYTTNKAQIVVNVDNFDAAKHTAAARVVLSSGTVVTPDAVRTAVDPSKPTRITLTADFTLPANTPAARARFDTTSTTAASLPFGQDIQFNPY